MNRIVLIGNGFDLSHGLKTSYADFIKWYCDKIIDELKNTHSQVFKNNHLETKCEFAGWSHYFSYYDIGEQTGYATLMKIIDNKYDYKTKLSTLFSHIIRSIDTKGWVDIENEYYALLKDCTQTNNEDNARNLNIELENLKELLIEYLEIVNQQKNKIKDNVKEAIYAPIDPQEVSIEAMNEWEKVIDYWKSKDQNEWRYKLERYGITDDVEISNYLKDAKVYKPTFKGLLPPPSLFRLPDNILLLNFNYTKTAQTYLLRDTPAFTINNIHGQLEEPESIIFGHGDEMDEKFKQIQNLNIQEYLKNVKSINYLNSNNYRTLLRFIDSSPYQICIMGHSCGISDRTLLNTLFEHKNCISIKPFYHEKEDGTDNYIEIVQNISRNFNDMALMRDRVVNKTYCESMD